jgi:hypothetical protein
MNEREFRARLEQITTGRHAEAWLKLLEDLRAEYSHSIRLEEVALSRGFNCFAFALGLTESAAYKIVARETDEPNVFADEEFVEWLFRRDVLGPPSSDDEETLVVYFAGTQPKHAGRRTASGRVMSKWGTGFWFSHELLEVPADYGDTIVTLAQPDTNVVETAFLEFARNKNASVEHLLRRHGAA